MKKQKYHIVQTFQKSNIKWVERSNRAIGLHNYIGFVVYHFMKLYAEIFNKTDIDVGQDESYPQVRLEIKSHPKVRSKIKVIRKSG